MLYILYYIKIVYANKLNPDNFKILLKSFPGQGSKKKKTTHTVALYNIMYLTSTILYLQWRKPIILEKYVFMVQIDVNVSHLRRFKVLNLLSMIVVFSRIYSVSCIFIPNPSNSNVTLFIYPSFLFKYNFVYSKHVLSSTTQCGMWVHGITVWGYQNKEQ